MECHMCAKRISSHTGFTMCLACQKEIARTKGKEAAGIPSEDKFIKDSLNEIDWGRMGHWKSTGKGGVRVDTSPGAIFHTSALLFGFAGILFLFIVPIIGLGAFIVALLLQNLREKSKKDYLKAKYREKFSHIEDL